MKKSKKLLSILLAVIMVFSAVAVPVSAAVPTGVNSLDALIQPSNLSGLVDWLLSSLNNRKTYYADSVLNFVCTYVEDINALVPEGTDLFQSNDTAKKATYVMNYLDNMLAETNLNESLGEDIVKITEKLGIPIKLNSVDEILATLKSVDGVKVVAGGDIAKLKLDAMIDNSGIVAAAQTRSKTGDLNIIYNLIQFLADNTGVFQKFLTGKLDLGIVGDVAGDLEEQVNGFAGEITVMLEDLVYDSLLGAPDGAASHAESAYKNWTVDQMAVGALVKLLTGVVPDDTEQIDEFLNLPVYDLLTAYGDMLYDKFLLGWLQNDLVGILKEFAQDNDLSQYFNFDFTFTASEFNFANAQNGILGEFNNVFVALLNKLLAPAVLAELKLEKGGNDKLNANLEKVIKFILPKLADVIDPADFDFRKYTEEYVADKDLPELAVDILKLFFPGWFKLDDAALDVVDQMDTMGEVATMAVYYALITFNTEMFAEGNYDYVAEWDVLIFEEDGKTINDLSNSAWGDICLSMATDAAMFGFALNGANFGFDFSMDKIKSAKADDWTAEDFLDEIADWAIDMVKGVPAVTDHIGGARGKFDGNGPFYKLNVLLNEILDWSFLSGVSYASFNLDIETLVFDGILENVYEFDIAGILGLFAVNDKANNVLNKKTVPALLGIVDNVLNILFKHEGATATATVDPTCEEDGFSVKHCVKCGLYTEDPKKGAAATGHDKQVEIITDATCQQGGIARYTCKKCDYVHREKTEVKDHRDTTIFYQEGGTWYSVMRCADCGRDNGDPMMWPSPDAIEIVTAPTKTEYELNSDETLSLDGIFVNAIFSGAPQAITAEMLTIETELDLSVAGEQEITVSFLGKTATFTVTVVDPNAKPEYLIGDVDGDNKVTSSDARLALRASVKLEKLDEIALLAADVDDDGAVTSSDARLILRASVGLETLK